MAAHFIAKEDAQETSLNYQLFHDFYIGMLTDFELGPIGYSVPITRSTELLPRLCMTYNKIIRFSLKHMH